MADHSHHRPRHVSQAPAHPVAQLQGPFEESMLESVTDDDDSIYLDPITRRNTLLEAPIYTRVVAGRWKQKPGEKYHPLWKLIAQISFGVHLLAEGMARSEDDVMQILQSHVDEIDGFLERTTEDFDLAAEDIQERLRCLKLPLSHPATFDKMLEDRNFRLSIVEGNEKIEHIVERTSQAMKDSLKDVQKGFDSTSCLETYLQGLSHTWIRQSVEHEAVFVAMLGNVEGWRKAFMSLHMQGNKLGGSLKKLTDIINEMQARAGEVSRRLLHQARVQHHQSMGRPIGRSTPTSRYQTMPDKQLPGMPSRSSLRQPASNDTLRTNLSVGSPSQESLRQQALLNRSRTPQNEMPPPRQVRTGASPRLIQIGSNSPGRVQSMVPSLMDTTPSPRDTTVPVTAQGVQEHDEAERYFPPIELPAHVPEETTRQVPMSRQNRLSVGMGLTQVSYSEKRNSTLDLIDLLRSNPTSQRSSANALTPQSTRSLQASRRTSATALSAGAGDRSSAGTKQFVLSSSPRASSNSDTASQHAKTNIRRPKKGVQHWFDALDDDPVDNDKYSIASDSTHQVIETVHQLVSKPRSDHDSQPGTPSWAKTSFAQSDSKRAELKKGAFSSHPPDLPLGSPPMAQPEGGIFPDLLPVAPPHPRLSRKSSAGTLGEPGPAFTPSEFGSMSIPQELQTTTQAEKRASAYAPEVLFVHKMPALPSSKKQFVAEMEGSTPPMYGRSTSAAPAHIMELEAPQQHFKLPPRPQPLLEANPKQQVTTVTSSIDDSKPPLETQVGFDGGLPTASSAIAKTKSDEEIATPDPPAKGLPAEGKVLEPNAKVDKDSNTADAGERLPSTVFVATPNIPLPPSPYEEEQHAEAQQEPTPEVSTREEPLYLLPALTYKAPSPQLPPIPRFETNFEQLQIEHDSDKGSAPEPEIGLNRSSSPLVQQAEDALKEQLPPPLSITTNISKPEADQDSHKYEMFKPASPQIVEPTSLDSAQPSSTLQREHKPAQLKHERSASSHGSQNGWKAFFTGQPSPVGSNLSIRSIKRDSVIEQSQQSPARLSPASASASSKHHFPTSPVIGTPGSAKDVVWFNKPFDETISLSTTVSDTSLQTKEPGGLGIAMIKEKEDAPKAAVSAAS